MKSRSPKEKTAKINKKEKKEFELRFYSGYKGGETPRAVVIGDKEFTIEEILWRKRVLDKKTGKKYEIFKCRMEGDIIKITIYESGEWSISFSDET